MKELLEKLEKRVACLINKSKKLREEKAKLESKLQTLKADKGKLEDSLLKEHGNVDNLVKEKGSIKGAIGALLENIDALESSKEQ